MAIYNNIEDCILFNSEEEEMTLIELVSEISEFFTRDLNKAFYELKSREKLLFFDNKVIIQKSNEAFSIKEKLSIKEFQHLNLKNILPESGPPYYYISRKD